MLPFGWEHWFNKEHCVAETIKQKLLIVEKTLSIKSVSILPPV